MDQYVAGGISTPLLAKDRRPRSSGQAESPKSLMSLTPRAPARRASHGGRTPDAHREAVAAFSSLTRAAAFQAKAEMSPPRSRLDSHPLLGGHSDYYQSVDVERLDSRQERDFTCWANTLVDRSASTVVEVDPRTLRTFSERAIGATSPTNSGCTVSPPLRRGSSLGIWSRISDSGIGRLMSGAGSNPRSTSPTKRKWRTTPMKFQRKLAVIEISQGTTKSHQIQTPELMRMIHSHNKRSKLEDTMAGSVKLRDLRQVCAFHQTGHRPSLEPRRNCILVNLPRIRCVILHNKVLAILAQGDCFATSPSSDVDDDDCGIHGTVGRTSLLEKLTRLSDMKSGAPLEFSVLEAVLVEECSLFNGALAPLTASAQSLITVIQQAPSKTNRLRDITELKRRIDSLADRIRGCQTAIQEVLNNEEDIRRLEISRFWENPEDWEDPEDTPASEDAEILLECYEQEVESFLKQLTRVDEQLDDALQIQQLHLASVRNVLIKAELALEIVGVVIGMVGAIAGIFGMNIPNGYEDERHLFWPLTHSFAALVFLTGASVAWLFRRLQL